MTGFAQVALWLVVLLPAVVGTLLCLGRRLERMAGPLSLITATATLALSLAVVVERAAVAVPFVAGSSFGLGVDALSAFVVPTVSTVTLLVLLFAAVEMDQGRARFHGLMLLFASSALLTAMATSLPTLLFAWELMGATSYALIGFWWRDDPRMSAALTAFITTRTADLGLYLAAGAAMAGGAGLALADLPDSAPGWRDVVAAGVLVAALGKAAQLPFAFWISRAMAGPSPVSALLHSAAMVALGSYLLLRAEPLLAATGWAAPTTAWLGAITAVALGAVAVAQSDLKQLLAASTSAQLAFVVMAAGVGTVSGGVAQLVAHAATKALLFLTAGAWLTALGTKRLDGLRGVARRWRLVGVLASVGLLSLAGIVPLSLWATKDAVLAAAWETSVWLYAVGVVGAALSAAYAAKVLWLVWQRVSDSEQPQVQADWNTEQQGTGTIGRLEQAPLVVLAFGAAVLGILVLPPLSGALGTALGDGSPEPALFVTLLSSVFAFLTLFAVRRWGVPEPAWAREWLWLERAAHLAVVRPTVRLARALARFDDRVLDRAVDATAEATLRIAGRLSQSDRVGVDGAVEWFAGGMRTLGRLARRPQTGQLYQYYLQSVAVLAFGVILLVTVR